MITYLRWDWMDRGSTILLSRSNAQEVRGTCPVGSDSSLVDYLLSSFARPRTVPPMSTAHSISINFSHPPAQGMIDFEE